MKIDLDWIQKELDAGREVELERVDITGFLEFLDISEANEKILDQELLVVDYIDSDGDIRLVGHIDDLYLNVIASEEFKYFRIKQAPTFDDLIDVAVQAYKDGVADKLELGYADGIERVNLHIDGHTNSYYQCSVIEEHIKHINSLYTETFVIEDFQDTKKLKSGAKAILSNGEEVVFSNRTGVDDSLWFKYNGCYSDGCYRAIIPYIALKGATVTQQKGNK